MTPGVMVRAGSEGLLRGAGAVEIESASRVQSRLLPRRGPWLATLKYGALACPARGVGGDYYDFMPVGPRRVAIALGDISGKGVPAALMTAALQASLRSHYAVGAGDLAERLRSVNRLFRDWTATGDFATLFVGEYDDRTGVLRYANCGHVPPLLRRADGVIERLAPTAPVIGVLAEWPCAIAEARLAAGDTLLIYSDGASEARNRENEEFGEDRLAACLGAVSRMGVAAALAAIADQVRRFECDGPGDDLTLVIACSRPRGGQPERLRGRAAGADWPAHDRNAR